MRIEYQIIVAFALDAVLGDPAWFPHPVRFIGKFAAGLEQPLRSSIRNAFVAGLLLWLIVAGVVGGIVGGVLFAAYRIHPAAGDIAGIFLFYLGFAGRDLFDHANRVYKALIAGNLPEARRLVGMMVGRDTANLDQAGIARATVESTAESMLDGVTAPIFFAVIGGPVGLWIYKAVNTLDSMIGHKDRRYLYFGRAAAKIDDAANYIPARLTAPLVAVAALLTGCDARASLRMLRRDGRKHPSPNAGLCEAAFAGAMGVQLGGLNYYDGQPEHLPVMGDAKQALAARHIRQANRLMIVTALLFLLLLVTFRLSANKLIPIG
jgi:adenosylcobinamide-phosphate synthase